MKCRATGFVLFSVMLIIMIITLFSLMLLQTDAEALHLARMSKATNLGKMKAKQFMQALVASGVGDTVRCDATGLSPDALLHASDAWWAMNACKINEHVWFVRESPRVSDVDRIATPAGWVAAQYYYLTLRYQVGDAAPIVMQALMAEPSAEKPKGLAMVASGMQQLACLSD